jgi:hypothetical protein
MNRPDQPAEQEDTGYYKGCFEYHLRYHTAFAGFPDLPFPIQPVKIRKMKV